MDRTREILELFDAGCTKKEMTHHFRIGRGALAKILHETGRSFHQRNGTRSASPSSKNPAPAEKQQEILRLFDEGCSRREIEQRLHLGHDTITRIVAQAGKSFLERNRSAVWHKMTDEQKRRILQLYDEGWRARRIAKSLDLKRNDVERELALTGKRVYTRQRHHVVDKILKGRVDRAAQSSSSSVENSAETEAVSVENHNAMDTPKRTEGSGEPERNDGVSGQQERPIISFLSATASHSKEDRKITEEVKEKLLALFDEGVTKAKIIRSTGITETPLDRLLQQHGRSFLQRQQQNIRPVTTAQKEEILRLFDLGHSQHDIIERVGVKRTGVERTVAAVGKNFTQRNRALVWERRCTEAQKEIILRLFDEGYARKKIAEEVGLTEKAVERELALEGKIVLSASQHLVDRMLRHQTALTDQPVSTPLSCENVVKNRTSSAHCRRAQETVQHGSAEGSDEESPMEVDDAGDSILGSEMDTDGEDTAAPINDPDMACIPVDLSVSSVDEPAPGPAASSAGKDDQPATDACDGGFGEDVHLENAEHDTDLPVEDVRKSLPTEGNKSPDAANRVFLNVLDSPPTEAQPSHTGPSNRAPKVISLFDKGCTCSQIMRRLYLGERPVLRILRQAGRSFLQRNSALIPDINQITEQQKAQILQLFDEGCTVDRIMERVGVHRQGVSTIVKRAGKSFTQRNRAVVWESRCTEEQKEMICRLFAEGHSRKEIGKRVGLTRHGVDRELALAGKIIHSSSPHLVKKVLRSKMLSRNQSNPLSQQSGMGVSAQEMAVSKSGTPDAEEAGSLSDPDQTLEQKPEIVSTKEFTELSTTVENQFGSFDDFFGGAFHLTNIAKSAGISLDTVRQTLLSGTKDCQNVDSTPTCGAILFTEVKQKAEASLPTIFDDVTASPKDHSAETAPSVLEIEEEALRHSNVNDMHKYQCYVCDASWDAEKEFLLHLATDKHRILAKQGVVLVCAGCGFKSDQPMKMGEHIVVAQVDYKAEEGTCLHSIVASYLK